MRAHAPLLLPMLLLTALMAWDPFPSMALESEALIANLCGVENEPAHGQQLPSPLALYFLELKTPLCQQHLQPPMALGASTDK